MDQRFFQRLVGVFVLDVLADDADRDFVLRVVDAVNDVFPLLQVAVFGIDVQIAERERVHFFTREHDRHFVDRRDVFAR